MPTYICYLCPRWENPLQGDTETKRQVRLHVVMGLITAGWR